MIDATQTTSALLACLREGENEAAWGELDRRYRPIVANLARKAGLHEADAEDVAQETLTDVFKGYKEGRYERSRGRLRAWLIGIAKFKIVDAKRRGARGGETLKTSLLTSEGDEVWGEEFEREVRAGVLVEALAQLRTSGKVEARNLNAFELVALRGVPVAQVAESMGMTAQEVYLAKSRCLERVRGIVEQLQAAYEAD